MLVLLVGVGCAPSYNFECSVICYMYFVDVCV